MSLPSSGLRPAPAGLPLLLAALAFTLLLSPLRRELYVGDETKYGQIVREMRQSGNLFLPTLEGRPFTHKPPIHFWMVWALTFLFGLYSTFAFALPSIIAFAVLLWLLWRFAGPLAAFLCGTSAMVWGSAQTARMDVAFTALLVAGAIFVYRHFEGEDRRALPIAATLFGIATLVKGPMAPVIAILLFAFESLRRKRRPRLSALWSLLLMAAIPLLWFIPATMIGGSEFTEDVVVKQTVRRAVGSWVHRSPPWYYVTHAPGFLFPWCFLLIVALIALRKRKDAETLDRFCVSWLLAVFVPYSVMSSKLDIYMMALIPPSAILVARFVARELDDRWVRIGHIANAALLVVLAVIAAVGATLLPRFLEPDDAALATRGEVRALFVVLGIAAIAAFFLTIRRSLYASTIAVGLVPWIALVYAALFLIPLANREASTQPLISAIVRQRVPARNVALHACPHVWSRSMPMDLEAVRYTNADDLQTAEPEVIITSRKHAEAIAGKLRSYRKVDELRMIGKMFDVYRR